MALLGMGNELSVNLSDPPPPTCSFTAHTITLNAKDSNGNVGSNMIMVAVGGIC
jgi:hypothetical protein